MRRISRSMVFVLILALAVLAIPLRAESAPTRFNFQGRITNLAGAPVTSAQTVRFSLIQGGTAGEPISSGTVVYQEDALVTPDSHGVFAHAVGSGSPVGGHTLAEPDFITNGQPLFVEASIAGSPLLPRTQMLSTGYAIEASRLDGKSAAEIMGVTGGNALINMVFRHGAGLEWVSASDIRVKAGTLGFSDGKVRMNAAPLTWSLSNGVGPLGLDTGAEAANTWYYLYAVPDPADDGKFTAVGSAREPLQSGGLGPAGYGIHRYLGAVRNDGASNLPAFYRAGDNVMWKDMGPLWLFRDHVPQAAVNTWVTVDASGATPATAAAVRVTGYHDAWCNAAVTFYLGTATSLSTYFATDWQNGSSTSNADVPLLNRTFSYYAVLHSGWSNDSCQYTAFYYTGYVEDLSSF